MSTPNCPACNGETELNGNGGICCYFCGFDSGKKPPEPAKSGPGKIMEFLPTETLPDGRILLKKT